ncbi:Hypothetical protein ABZS17G119_02863 [Kosakonia cowanii]
MQKAFKERSAMHCKAKLYGSDAKNEQGVKDMEKPRISCIYKYFSDQQDEKHQQ